MVRKPVRRYTKKYQYITYYHKIVYLNRSTMYLNQTQMARNTYHITITSPIRQPNIIFSTQTPTVPPISKFLGNKHTHILCIPYGIPITIHFFTIQPVPKTYKNYMPTAPTPSIMPSEISLSLIHLQISFLSSTFLTVTLTQSNNH